MDKQRRKTIIWLLVAVVIFLLSILGVFAPLQSLGIPALSVLSAPFAGLRSGFDSTVTLLFHLQDIDAENAYLQGEVADLSVEVAKLAELEQQNKWLREQLNVTGPIEGVAKLAKVERYEYVPVAGYMYAYVGNDSAVEVDDWAVNGNFIIGQVVSVTGSYAKIRLLNASDSRIPVKVGSSVLGFLQGESGIDMEVTDVEVANETISGGEEITLLTEQSSLATYSLGTAIQVLGVESEATKTIDVNLPIDLYQLEYIIILSADE